MKSHATCMTFFVNCIQILYFYSMFNASEIKHLKLQTLKHFWGHTAFRDLQEEIINAVLQGEDTVALLPTGGGKSLCFQLPALLLQGVCIVVSPLLALMKDQVDQLLGMGIEADYLSSDLDEFEAEGIYDRCKNGLIKILYISPERLRNKSFLQHIEEVDVSFIAVDEAHCISEWGQDFRPSFQNIKEFRNEVKKVPIIALTATATPTVLVEIQTKLGLQTPAVFKKSFSRTNIKIITEKIADKFQKIFDWLQYNQNSGIIYARTRKETEELHQFLKSKGINSCDFFHAGLSYKEKQQKQAHWLQSNNHVLIATNAFGMGIDKDNVRFVMHLSVPPSIENYYQEIGRAGRDGQDSFAFCLWNDQEFNKFDDILKNSIPNKIEFTKILYYLFSMFQIAENELPEEYFQLNYQNLQRLTGSSLAKIKNVLQFLHNQELIYLNDFKDASTVELKISVDDLDSLPKKDTYFVELLFRCLPGITSSKVHFYENTLSDKMRIEPFLIKDRLKELQKQKLLNYIDGDMSSIRFLEHRNDRAYQGKYYQLFKQIQINKLQKWEEIKFFFRNDDFCKMKMILSYFGEKNAKNCGQCSYCERSKSSLFSNQTPDQILNVLRNKPCSLDEIAFHLSFVAREDLLENIILLLDSGLVKMLDFRTYTLA